MTSPPITESAGGALCAALRAAARSGDAVREVDRVLRQWAGERVYIPRSAAGAELLADRARRLVFAGVGRTAALAILRSAGASDRHARRLVAAAIAIRGHSVSKNVRNAD
jgi:hypothetical protein